jgi:hypothetical protein
VGCWNWKDADLPTNGEEPDWDSGTIFVQENVWFEKFREYKLMIFKPVVGSTASTNE